MEFEKHKIDWTQEKTSRFWDFITRNSSLSNKYFGLHWGKHFTDILNKKIKLTQNKRILDMSCGQGDILSQILTLTHNNQEIYGTDLSEQNVIRVNDRFSSIQSFCGAKKQNELPLLFQDNFFNLIILTEVIEHLDDKEFGDLLNESFRLIAPGGFIAITTPNNEDLNESTLLCPDCGCVFHRWQHVRSWTPKSLLSAMEDHAFNTLHCSPISWGRSSKEIFALKIAEWANLIKPQGLLYIGMKPQD